MKISRLPFFRTLMRQARRAPGRLAFGRRLKRFSFPALAAVCLLVFTGCESDVVTSDIMVRAGMPRDHLKQYYGEPLRIEKVAGGEDWYYNFIGWKSYETHSSGYDPVTASSDYSASVGISTSRETSEQPIHISAEGIVITPIPKGKVVR